MADAWRLLDTGLRPAAQNIALNRVLLEGRAGGSSPPTLRFLRFEPSALIGYHQSAAQELDLDYCAAHGIAVQRRITGGGAIYFDQGQLGWELYLSKRDVGSADMGAIAQRICETAARAIAALGVDARFRPRNDIEVGGRKISGTGGVWEGDALMYQGTLLVEFDVERMLRCLRIPAEKLSDKAIASARERVASLAELLGFAPGLAEVQALVTRAFAAEFGVAIEAGTLDAAETAACEAALAEIESPEWLGLVQRPAAGMPVVEALRKFAGGMVRAGLSYDRLSGRIKQVWLTGDFFIQPRRAIADLEAALRDSVAAELERNVEAFFAARRVDMLGLAPADLAGVMREALDQVSPREGAAA